MVHCIQSSRIKLRSGFERETAVSSGRTLRGSERVMKSPVVLARAGLLLCLLLLIGLATCQRPTIDSKDEEEPEVVLPEEEKKEEEGFVPGPAPKEGLKKNCPEFKCAVNTGNHADPCTCRRFYICSTDGSAHRSFCPNGLFWDDEKKFCTYREEVKCGPVTKKKVAEVITVKPCDKDACQLPFCYCSYSGSVGPAAGVDRKFLPQMVVMTFDGAVNTNNWPLYDALLKKKHGKNGKCPLRGTFFVRNDYNNYQMIEDLYYRGNEIAINTVTGRNLQYENVTVWKEEIEVMRDLLGTLANVPAKDILGVRGPSLKPGFNDQYQAVVEANFLWDSTISTKITDAPIWPYTLDYQIPHECKIKSCPTKSFPGLWEIPVNIHHNPKEGGGQCSYMDQCVFALLGADDVFEWLKGDFARHYDSNRAPYMLPFHTNWFTHKHQVEGLHKFIDWTLEKDNVYYVTATEALLWMLEPSESLLKEVTGTCEDKQNRRKTCSKPKTCELEHVELDGIATLRYLTTCYECPSRYPTIPSLEHLYENRKNN